jgi:glycosyltransferase involved in cell wall biosynthesis
MKIGLFIPSLHKYDAMGNDVLMMYKILKNEGYSVVVFANDYDSLIDANIQNISKSKPFLNNSNNILIYHHGIYTDFFNDIANSKCYKIFRYHNITYPELFKGYDENTVKICTFGREQMKNNVNKFDYFLSCSEFNNNELINDFNIQKEKTEILPPFHRVEEWKNIQENELLQEKLENSKIINMLNVGRLSPNKNHIFLIKSFSDFTKYYKKDAYLHIVGKIGPMKYYEEILQCIKDENMEDRVKLYTDGIPESDLKTLYKYSDIFLMTSLHEGFCVPIVESMYFGLPIISLDNTALSDTIGKNGILLKNKNVEEFSSAIYVVNQYKKNLSQLSQNGYDRMSYEKIKEIFLKFIQKVIKNV